MEFNDEWKIYKLENLFDIKAAGDLDKNTFSNDCDRIFKYPLYANALTNKGLIGFSSIAKYPKNSLTVTARGDLGKAFVRKTKFNASGRLLILQQKVNLDLEFISNYINGKLNIFIENTGVPQLTAPNFKTYKIKMPILEEQQKIGRFLSLINEKIELMEKKYKTLQKYKSALIQQIFTKNIRFSNFSNNWNYYSLGELGETYSGLTGLSKENFEQGDSKFIPYKVIFDNEVIDINSLEPVQLNNKKQEPVKKGDLFFTGSSETPEEVGMVSVLNKNIENCYLNSFCFGYRLNDFMKVNPLFLSYLLRSPLIRRKIKVLGQGSTRFNISKKEIMKLTVEIPPLEEQKKIITILENLTNNIHFMKNKNSKIKEFKKYLLQQMFV